MAKITFPVEAGHIMLFARAIGDYNPVYHDAEAAKKTEVGGVIASPTFPQAVAQFDPDYLYIEARSPGSTPSHAKAL